MRKIFIVFLMCLFASVASAATYYIDYNAANDSANGITKSTPWKRHPYMTGWSGSGYSHSAGDQFIFKGGVTWPRSCFSMVVTAGGSSGSRDYYGVDATWYTGGSWTRPIFDMQNTVVGWSEDCIQLNSQSNIDVDNLEIKNFKYQGGGASYTANSIGMYLSTNITIKNCLIHDWSCSNCVNLNDDSSCAGGVCGPSSDNVIVEDCVFYGIGYGGAIKDVFTARRNIIHDLANAVVSASYIYDNTIYDLLDGVSPVVDLHENAIEVFAPSRVYNNEVKNAWAVSLLMSPGFSGGSTGTSYLFNNVFYGSNPIPIIDNDNLDNSGHTIYIFNNTFYGGSNPCIRFIRENGKQAKIYLQNNHCISDYGSIYTNESDISAGFTSSNNLLQTTSQAANSGYTESNKYMPTSGSSPTVDVGADLSAYFTAMGLTAFDKNNLTRSGVWDIGAYEYAGGGVPPPAGTALSRSTINPRYFKLGETDGIYLTGSHTWDLVQGENWVPDAAYLSDYLDWMQSHGHNFVRLWTNWSYMPYTPAIWATSGSPVKAQIGTWNDTYWTALRSAVLQITGRGMYCSVMLLGSANGIKSDWANNWWNPNNHTASPALGLSTTDGYTFFNPPTAALNAQKAVIAKTIDTLNDQPNIMWEIINEAPFTSAAYTTWQNTLMAYVRSYESTKALQHIILMSGAGGLPTTTEEARLFASTADVISPDGLTPYSATEGGNIAYTSKSVIYDTDHIYGFSHPDYAEAMRKLIWRSFTRGHNPIFMDSYDYDFEPYNDGTIMAVFDPIRNAMGHTLNYANRMDMTATTPSSTFSSSGYALVNAGKTYLIYQPNVSTTYTYTLPTGTWAYELFNTVTGGIVASGTTSGGWHSSTSGSTDEVLFFYIVPSVAPEMDNLSPTGVHPCTGDGVSNVTLSLTTDQQAWARMNPDSDIDFAFMTDDFANTGSTYHSETKSLACGSTYTYYVKVRNADWDVRGPSIITFTISSQGVAGPGGLRLTGGVRFGH